MAVCNDSVKADLVKIGSLELQHLVDASPVDLVCCVLHSRWSAISTTKASADELLTKLVEKIECSQMRTCRDFDELSEAISNLGFWERAKECEVKECLHWCVVCTKSVLVVAIVDRHLDRDGCINQTNDGGRYPNEVCVSAVCSTSKSVKVC